MAARERKQGTALLILDMVSEFTFPDAKRVLRGARAPARGRDVVELIAPALDRDYFMFKPKHSAFFGTPLQSLLQRLGVRRLVLSGTTSHQCVLFTAMDAHVREYDLIVPADCVGAGSRAETRHALFIAARALGARTAVSTRLRL
jgi:nicotinamidase-related amidase